MNNVQKKESSLTPRHKPEGKKARTRQRLLEHTHTLIREKGVHGFTARDVAKRAKVAVGTLYTAFESFDDLIFRTNQETLDRLQEALVSTQQERTPLSPEDTLLVLGLTYLDFAKTNRAAWLAMFTYSPQTTTPAWVLESHLNMLSLILPPLEKMFPNLPQDERLSKGKTLFLSVHGLIQFSLEKRFVGLKDDEIAGAIEAVVTGTLKTWKETHHLVS